MLSAPLVIATAAGYLLLTLPLSAVSRLLERRYRYEA
jgi:ABC-type amino acid transport system permease subunit